MTETQIALLRERVATAVRGIEDLIESLMDRRLLPVLRASGVFGYGIELALMGPDEERSDEQRRLGAAIWLLWHVYKRNLMYSNPVLDDLDCTALAALESIGYWNGVLRGADLYRATSTSAAAAARRAQGQAKRDRVIAAALPHAFKSKRQAAYAVSDELNIDFELIRRILTDTFPGKAWDELLHSSPPDSG